MTAQSDKGRWKKWADSLRQEMMIALTPQVTKSVDAIAAETGTTKSKKTLKKVAFWRSCQTGAIANDSLIAAGFEIEFQENEDRCVSEVTFKLNSTWLSIMQKVINRTAN